MVPGNCTVVEHRTAEETAAEDISAGETVGETVAVDIAAVDTAAGNTAVRKIHQNSHIQAVVGISVLAYTPAEAHRMPGEQEAENPVAADIRVRSDCSSAFVWHRCV